MPAIKHRLIQIHIQARIGFFLPKLRTFWACSFDLSLSPTFYINTKAIPCINHRILPLLLRLSILAERGYRNLQRFSQAKPSCPIGVIYSPSAVESSIRKHFYILVPLFQFLVRRSSFPLDRRSDVSDSVHRSILL